MTDSQRRTATFAAMRSALTEGRDAEPARTDGGSLESTPAPEWGSVSDPTARRYSKA